MPNQYDENANQDQFFCGQSWSDAKHVCEPCPGGSRLECSNVGHDCFAGVTGCPPHSALSNNNSVDNNSNSNNNNDHLQSSQQTVLDTNINIQSQQQPSPAIVFVNPTPPTTSTSFTSSSNNNNIANNKCTSHSNCQNGQLCNKQGYCGQCSNEGRGCSVDQVCRTTASCHVTQTPGPGKCYQKEELHRFCQTAWKDESYQCNLDLMVCEETTTNANVIQVAVETQTTTTTTTPALVSVVPATTAASLPSSKPTNTPSKALITSGPINANAPAKCSICGDLQVDNDATIFYDGRELSCTELEYKVFLLVGIAMGSENCLASQELYSATCCIDPPVNPCNLCRSGDNDFPLKSEVNVVSAAGETESCLEVFQSLLSRREQSSWQCRSSQKELQAKCCDGTTFDYGNAPVPSPGVDWSPSLGVDEPASYPSEGFYYTKPDWNWKENWKNCSSRITSTTTAFALVSMVWLLWQ